MHRQIYVNLAVDDLSRSKAFFSHLGFEFEPRFTNDQGACMIVGENIYAMLLIKPFFQSFSHKPLCDASKSIEALMCLSCDSRAQVDRLVTKAVAAGGTATRQPQDYGFMYEHGFEDVDGHIWQLIHLDPDASGAAS
ncbi:VOC family protein [Paraburkholderia sp.]|uniref:VOC family protein n=1 Tax=Paraburkholderia sp. TaxID=1926495 RepID=UPI003D6F3A72